MVNVINWNATTPIIEILSFSLVLIVKNGMMNRQAVIISKKIAGYTVASSLLLMPVITE
jgi:hypothetical protein